MQARGYLFAFITITIWSGWAIITRLGANAQLSVMDLAILRFLGAGSLMLPLAIKYRKFLTRENARSISIMVFGAGIGYFLIMGLGFKYAPAGHSILTPCSMTAFVAIGSYLFLKEKFSSIRIVGYSLIICGVIFKLSYGALNGDLFADLLFLGGAICWTSYTIQTKKSSHIPPLANAAFVQVGSMILIAVPYAIYQFNDPHALPLKDSVIQLIYQGLFTSVISLILYVKAIEYIGTSRASSFAALLPVMVLLGSIPILGEHPSGKDIVFAGIMSAGVFLASGITNRILKRPPKSSQKDLHPLG